MGPEPDPDRDPPSDPESDEDGNSSEEEGDGNQNERPYADAANVDLYPGAPVTVGESLHMVLCFALSYSLTGKCVGGLLELIAHHCIQPRNCVTSLYHFKKYFASVEMPLRRHYYCSSCLAPWIGEGGCNVCEERVDKSYFITLPLAPQLKSMFKRNGFHGKLRYRFNRVKTNELNFEDIQDGEIYREFSRDGNFLSDPNAISFCWNTDGVPMYKSSNYSIWPFFLRLNELSYHERVRKENILLAGLWFGPRKPSPNLFMLPMVEELQVLRDGIQVQVPNQQEPITVKCMVLCGTADMPAKALFMNFKSYNGFWGCTACFQRGERYEGRHVYRYQNNYRLRRDEDVHDLVATANEAGEPVLGVKGASMLSRMVSKLISSTSIDPMHKYSGLTMKLLEIWLSSTYSDHRASLRHHFALIDKRLCDILPPWFVERLPRSLKHLKYEKISELKLMLFVYAIPILHDLMTPHLFNHFTLLVGGLHLLNQSSISPRDLDMADSLLREFVIQFELMYGLEHMSCNVHQLLHLATFVRNLGPLFCVSCAPFENMNGVLKKFVHGTRYADLQVCTAASLYVGLQVFKERDLRDDGPVQEFCEKLCKRSKRLRLVRLTEAVAAADSLQLLEPVPVMIRNALNALGVNFGSVHIFKKAYCKRQLYVSQLYTRAKKTNSSCVKFRFQEAHGIGLIQSFVRVSDCVCGIVCQCAATCYAIIKKYATRNTFSTRAPRYVLDFIYECELTDNVVAVNVEDFISLCFHIVVHDTGKIYVVEPVNIHETDD